MYSILYMIYFYINRKNKERRLQGKQISCLMQKSIDYIEWYYNILLKKIYMKNRNKPYGLTKSSRKEQIIISLTSYPKRIETIWLTIETLLRQTVKADQIVLWLAENQFNGINSLPESLLKLQDRGLTIRFCDDLRSHKKYFYVMQENPDAVVILADDDMFYPKDTVKKLLQMHKKYPEDICCMSGQVMQGKGNEDLPSNWRNPFLNEKLFHKNNVQIFTGSGSLYPVGAIHKDAFNKSLLFELCPYADDLWLTYMAYKNNRKISVYHPWRAFPITIYGTSVDSLWYVNAEQGQNDEQWKAIKDYYSEKVNGNV